MVGDKTGSWWHARSGSAWLASVVLASVMALSAGCAAEPADESTSATSSSSTAATPSSTPISSTPSSEEGQTAGPSATPAPSPDTVKVVIITSETVGSQLQVTAMVPGASEVDGVCSLVVRSGAREAVEDIAGTPGNDVTYCGIMAVSVKDWGSDWSFHVTYRSSTRSGESENLSSEDVE